MGYNYYKLNWETSNELKSKFINQVIKNLIK